MNEQTITLNADGWRQLVAACIEVYTRRNEPRPIPLQEAIRGLKWALVDLVPRERWGEFVDQPEPDRPCFTLSPEAREVAREFAPVNMLLYCPHCSEQHIDEAKPDVCEKCGQDEAACTCATFTAWLNPPHKSHRCTICNHVWRPADVPTNGVLALRTRGERDGNPRPRYFATAADFERAVASQTSLSGSRD